MKPDRTEAVALWQSVPFLEGLPSRVVDALAAAATYHTYAQGAFVFQEDEPTAGLFLVEQGTVKICRFSSDGREHILHLSHRGDTFNDVSVLDGGPNPATVMAFTDVGVWRIARPDLQALAVRYPELAWALIESIARRTRYLVGIVQDLAMRNVKGRLARLLLEQAELAGRGEVPDPLTQEDMASRLGTVREVVGRALRSLTAEGVISMERQRIVILNRALLEQAAQV